MFVIFLIPVESSSIVLVTPQQTFSRHKSLGSLLGSPEDFFFSY